MVLLVLLAGTFRQGLYEVAHTLSHYISDGHTHHGHHSHHVGAPQADHEHRLLDTAETALAAHDDAPLSPDDRLKFSYDKILHLYVSAAVVPLPVVWQNRKIPLFDLQLPAAPFLRTATPPPDRQA